MAKNDKSQMVIDAEAEAAAKLAARTYVADPSAWDHDGEEYGGKSEILELQIGEVSKPLTYVGHQEMTTNLGDTTVHMGTTEDGETMRLPIQATFQRAVDQAGLMRGDTFIIKRFENQVKKAGKGKGNEMAIYGIKVKDRAPRPLAAAAAAVA